MGSFAASAITSVTAQNTQGVQAIHPVPTEVLVQQIVSVMEDLQPAAVKIGMVCDAEIAMVIAQQIKKYHPAHVVYDPVMVATSGSKLMTDDTIQTIREQLIPQATVITPNLHEARILLERTVSSVNEMKIGARELGEKYGCSVLIKGGHLEGDAMCDVFYNAKTKAIEMFTAPHIESTNLHGTGCTLSSAIATQLAQDKELSQAISIAKQYVFKAIEAAADMHIGHGYGPLWHFYQYTQE